MKIFCFIQSYLGLYFNFVINKCCGQDEKKLVKRECKLQCGDYKAESETVVIVCVKSKQHHVDAFHLKSSLSNPVNPFFFIFVFFWLKKERQRAELKIYFVILAASIQSLSSNPLRVAGSLSLGGFCQIYSLDTLFVSSLDFVAFDSFSSLVCLLAKYLALQLPSDLYLQKDKFGNFTLLYLYVIYFSNVILDLNKIKILLTSPQVWSSLQVCCR